MKTGFLFTCALLLTGCSGGFIQQSQPTPTVWVTPLPVPTVAVSESLPCHQPATIGVVYYEEIKPHLSWISGPMGSIGENPALLLDEEFVDDLFTRIDEYYQKALLQSQQETPKCVAEYRNLTLETLGLAHHFWALVKAGNAKAATEQVLPAINEKLNKLLTEVQPALFEEAGFSE